MTQFHRDVRKLDSWGSRGQFWDVGHVVFFAQTLDFVSNLVSTAAATASQFVFGESSDDYANGDGRAGVPMDLTVEGDNDSNVEGGDNIETVEEQLQ